METVKKSTVEGLGNLSAYQVAKHDYRAQKLLDKCTGVDTGSVILRDTGEEAWIISGSATQETATALQKFLNGEQEFKGQYSVNISSSFSKCIVHISALAKTEEFGGGGGVAGGSDLTRIVEANQCITCAQLQYGTGEFESHVSLGKGETIANLEAEKECLDQTWKDSVKAVGDSLVDRFSPGYWHWQDSFVKSIQNIYANLGDKLAGTFDRYNPADIWYTDQPYESISEVGGVQDIYSLADLTKVLNSLYKNGTVVGISLKKTSKPDLQDYTGDRRETKFDLEDIEVAERKKGTLYFNISFKLNGVSNLCQIRRDSFGYRATVKASREQKHYDGSVGRGIIQHCLGKIYHSSLEIFEPSFYLKNREQFSTEPETHRKGIFNSRETAIASSLDAIVTVLQNAGDESRKEFLGRLVRYAWSIHTDSCDFLKVA